jgi:hypothetical protein
MLIFTWRDCGKLGCQNDLLLLVRMLLEVDQKQLGVLRRALASKARNMQFRLGGDPGDDGFQREATLSTQLLRQVEALERGAGHRTWGIGDVES